MTAKTSTDIDIKKVVKSEKKEFKEPKLKFIEPKLTKHGDATKITGQFFGTFTP
jgi:hypothetical protein